MRNLRNIRLASWRRGLNDSTPITSACWDPSRDEILCTVGPTANPVSSTITLLRVMTTAFDSSVDPTLDSILRSTVVTSWDLAASRPHLPVDAVVDLHHSADTHTTYITLAGGDIVTVREPEEDGVGTATVELIGSFDPGIAAACWSPDDDLLAVVTSAHDSPTLLLLGRSSFDSIAEVHMKPSDLSASRHVAVGWGNRETQFRGRGAAAARRRDPTIPECIDQGMLSPRDDPSVVTLSWRGDGAFLAVSAVSPLSQQQQPDEPAACRRVIRVFTREGDLHSASEPVDGLEAAMSWRPAGNLIAAIARSLSTPDTAQVVFFERNGLRHGEFSLRDLQCTRHNRLQLVWNHDSTVLAVIFDDRFQLWTMGNYHWYLKHEMPVPEGCSRLVWHPEKALRVAALSHSSVLLAEYVFAVARGSTAPPTDVGAVAVIDGCTVKLTSLQAANIPPPMSMYDLTVEAPVMDVAFASGPVSTSITILYSTGLDIYLWDTGRSPRPSAPTHIRHVRHHLPLDPISSTKAPIMCANTMPRQLCVLPDGRVYVIAGLDGALHIQVVNPGTDKDIMVVEDQSSRLVHAGLSGLALFASPTTAYLQQPSGSLLRLGVEEPNVPVDGFPAFLPWFEVGSVHGSLTPFGLSRNGGLHAGQKLLAKNCTSFVVTPLHLIFTTGSHLVKFVHLNDGDELELPPDDAMDERVRTIERGALLIAALPTKMCLVLQMPRGNLETIYPRAMVLAGVRGLIDGGNYASAFTHCRTHRVELGILHDHNPAQFFASVGNFVDQLSSVAKIDLFLSTLQEQDVTLTVCKDTRRSAPHPGSVVPSASKGSVVPSASKINGICDAILAALETRRATNLQNIITAHVCKSPPALEDGLREVAGQMAEQDECRAKDAMEHICFLVDVVKLYDIALGLYDLDLALQMAERSQRDPREYIPFLRGLQATSPEARLRFVVDDHLGRRDLAVASLYALGAFDELREYARRYDLLTTAMRLCRNEPIPLRDLTIAYADQLESTSRFRDAALIHESLADFARAASCYRAAGPSCWRECLAAAQLQDPPLTQAALIDLATATSDALCEVRDFTSAANVQVDYLEAAEAAISCLCRGYKFSEAIRLVGMRGQPSLLVSAVDPGLVDAAASATELLADCLAQLRAQVPRIMDLRARAVQNPLGFFEGERAGDDGDGNLLPDDVSVVATSRLSTSASLFTRYTSTSSAATGRTLRREERRRARGRKGTVYEEEYLVNSVRRLAERLDLARADVAALVTALVRRGMPERARAAETLAVDVFAACADAVREIWGHPGISSPADPVASSEQLYGPAGGEAVFSNFLAERARAEEPPVMKAFEKLTLLP